MGLDNQRFQKIIKDKNQLEMRILEIGCGIGRILIPMSKIFGDCIGIDISSEMVRQGQKYVENIFRSLNFLKDCEYQIR